MGAPPANSCYRSYARYLTPRFNTFRGRWFMEVNLYLTSSSSSLPDRLTIHNLLHNIHVLMLLNYYLRYINHLLTYLLTHLLFTVSIYLIFIMLYKIDGASQLHCKCTSVCSSSSSSWLPAALRAAPACRYLIYSEADFEVFRLAGATRCTYGSEIWHGGGLRAKFHPIGATTRM